MTVPLILLILAVLVVAGDPLLRRVAGDVAARRLAPHLGARPAVDIRGWGSGWRLLTGRLPRVTIRATDVPAGRTRLAELEVHLRHVELPRAGRELSAASGRFRARLLGADLSSLVDLPTPAVLDLVDGGVRLTAPGGLAAEADLTVRDGAVLVEPRARLLRLLPRKLRIDLGELPAGARVERLRVTPSGVIATGPLRTDRLLAERAG